MSRICFFLVCVFCCRAIAADDSAVESQFDMCVGGANGAHPAMIECMDSEVARIKSRIGLVLASPKASSSVKAVLVVAEKTQSSWSRFVNDTCSIYIELDGQRGELLAKSCEVEEFTKRLKFFEDLVVQASL